MVRQLSLLLAASTLLFACGNERGGMTGPERLAASPQLFGMNIEAAGMATIPDVSLLGGKLTISYNYAATDGTGEDRAGSMHLDVEPARTATGTWRTVADNGTVYDGPISFDFKDDGTATGTYEFNGTAYRITIHFLK